MRSYPRNLKFMRHRNSFKFDLRCYALSVIISLRKPPCWSGKECPKSAMSLSSHLLGRWRTTTVAKSNVAINTSYFVHEIRTYPSSLAGSKSLVILFANCAKFDNDMAY